MVHDLTSNRDFGRRPIRLGRITLNKDPEDLSSPYGEVVLTGTADDRELKRYCLDAETDCKNICDCCGRYIGNKPWDLIKYTICKQCEIALEIMKSEETRDTLDLVIDENFNTRRVKPWDFPEEREIFTNNPLVWD